MILTSMLAIMVLIAIAQPNAGRTLAACIFSGAAVLYAYASESLVGTEYYLCAAMVDSTVIVLLSGIYPAPRLVGRLQAVCVASILLNFLGWAMWFFYAPPDVYDWAFIGLYTYAIYSLVKRDADDVVGGSTVHSWFSRFRRHPWARVRCPAKNEG